ncbi:MAG TPA: hypothetical protein VGO18_21975 [Steroidobacteraceae bacterium]|nr:hypothetical protein [Steroidobacteraceae bacterium]
MGWRTILRQSEHVNAYVPAHVDGDIADIRAALEWAFSAGGDPLLGIRITVASAALWFKQLLLPELRQHLEHAIVGLSESLYRELDSMGSRVGVTLVCPALGKTTGKTTIVSAPEYHNSVSPSMRYVPLNSLPPEEVAEQIFAAADARSFWFRPHTSQPHEMSGSNRASWARTS